MVPAEPPVQYQHSLTSGSIIIGIPLLLWSSLGLNRPFYSVWTIYKCIKICNRRNDRLTGPTPSSTLSSMIFLLAFLIEFVALFFETLTAEGTGRGACFCLPFVFLTPRVSRSRLMSWLSGDL
ncbi:hypothetical protein JB92DRAFT_2921691 [Gautieria morchelliformis]|nr:hypothetical protein JB92DRAFT_2921691 [Gautieria morchelliformis]